MHALATMLLMALPGTSSTPPLADVFVDVNASGCGSGDGSAGAPVCSITDGIGLAVDGDTIRIAPGTYLENVSLTFDLDLVGTGGAGVTIVNGGGSGSVITIPSAVTVMIDGLTVTGGRADWGAGIQVDGTLLLRNSTVTGNSTTGTGAANQGGGGIGTSGIFLAANIEIDNCLVNDNHASSTSFSAGGGIFLAGGSLTISNSTIDGNTTMGAVPTAVGSGGGLQASGSTTVRIDRSTFSNNDGDLYAGGVFIAGGSLEITESTFSSNTGVFAGAIQAFNCPLVMRNSTISDNSSAQGAGLYAYLGSGTRDSLLSNVTITRNQANSGAGVFISGQDATLKVHNSVIAGNLDTNPSFPGPLVGMFESLGGNLIGAGGDGFVDGVNGDQVGSLSIPLDPLLAPLADNGGPTETHALLPGSPAIDKGSNATFESFDQRGIARPQGLRPDVGAYEAEGNTVSLCNGDGGDGMGCTECPCGNSAASGTTGGCLNSAGGSARLEQIGSTSISLPPDITSDLRFSLVGALPLTFGILISSDTVAPNNPASPCFGLQSGIASSSSDGLACVSGAFQRHGTRRAHTNGTIGLSTLPWGGEAGPSTGIAQSPLLFAAGETRYFQVIYRDESFGSCSSRMNSSQAVAIVFTP